MSNLSDPLPWASWIAAFAALVLAFGLAQYLSNRALDRPARVATTRARLQARRAQAYVLRVAWSLTLATPAVLIALRLALPTMTLGMTGTFREWHGLHEYVPILLGAAAVLVSCRLPQPGAPILSFDEESAMRRPQT